MPAIVDAHAPQPGLNRRLDEAPQCGLAFEESRLRAWNAQQIGELLDAALLRQMRIEPLAERRTFGHVVLHSAALGAAGARCVVIQTSITWRPPSHSNQTGDAKIRVYKYRLQAVCSDIVDAYIFLDTGAR